MATHFKIFADDQVALFLMDGQISVREGKQLFLDYTSHPDFDPNHKMFTDATGVTGVDATFADILTSLLGMRKLLGQFETGASSVILVNSSTAFGVGRMLEAALSATSRIDMAITDNTQEAFELSGVAPELLNLFRSGQQIQDVR